MRSFEQRKAEILRRSEERLRKRRRRRYILLSGVPVVAAAVLCGGLLWLWQAPPPVPTPAPSESTANSPASAAENLSPYRSIEVQTKDSDVIRTVDAPERLNAVAELLPTLCAKDGLLDEDGKVIRQPSFTLGTPDMLENSQLTSSTQYTLRLTAADGSETVYILSYRILQRMTPNQVWEITADEWVALILALGLNE